MNVWLTEPENLLEEKAEEDPNLGGDACCCSLGHTAKCSSSTLMDLKTSEVLDMQLIQVPEFAVA